MNGVSTYERSRQLGIMSSPALWPTWPFLPVVRRKDGEEDVECGLMSVLPNLEGMTGFSATVFIENLFTLPPTLDEFMALPREVYDTVEEVYQSGWRVD